MTPTVSIIVPVYNAGSYIRRCVDSIRGQEFTDFELLLVDDGSTDSSGAICDEYAAIDPRIRTVHRSNSGVSDARNTALALAKGTYLQFVDSDDWITSDATKLLVRAARENGCDLVIADFYRVAGGRVARKGDIDEETVLSRSEYAEHMTEAPADYYYGVLWNKLYRRDLVEQHRLRMNSEISWCEDFMFNLEYIRYAERFIAVKAPIYYYVKTKGSLVAQSSSIANTIRMKLAVFEYYNNFYKNVFDEEYYEKNRFRAYRFLVDAASDGIVPPAILPGSLKLGSERINVSADAVSGDGLILDDYRRRKLIERHLETAALKNDMTLPEMWLLLYLSQPHVLCTRKELSEFTTLPRRTLSQALQRLAARGLIHTEEKRQTVHSASRTSTVRLLDITLLPEAGSVLADLGTALQDFEHTQFLGFTEEEFQQYTHLSQRVRENIQHALR